MTRSKTPTKQSKSTKRTVKRAAKTAKQRTPAEDAGIYLDIEWNRVHTSKWIDSPVIFQFYKGKILLSVPASSARANALKVHANLTLSGDAWLRIADIDALAKLLREARDVLVNHNADIRRIANCQRCQGSITVCDQHRSVFRKYGATYTPRDGMPKATARAKSRLIISNNPTY